MVKAIKKVELETKKSSKGTDYTVCNLTLSNGKVHQAEGFLQKETMDLINEVGQNKLQFDYLQKVSKNGNKYYVLQISLPEIEFTQTLFLKQSTIALINYLNK